jgi:RNA polymerase sigma factor (sigma-70 family)
LNRQPEFIHDLKKLDKNGFITAIYSRYGRKLYAYAVTNWKVTEDDAWDLIYKTLYKVMDSYHKYEFVSEEKFASFIFKIFINYLRNHYRDTKAERTVAFQVMDDVDLSSKNETEPAETANKKLMQLNEVLDNMEAWERMLLLMRSEGRAYSDIATYIDKPESQLKVYYQRLKERLTKKLNGE